MRKVAVITGTRAEYGILASVLSGIEAHASLSLQLIATGTHLTTSSIRDITYPIAARVRMQQGNGTTASPASSRAEDVQSLARGVAGMGNALDRLEPDIVLVIGDRIEALAGALAGQVGGRRVAHIHGGDRAEGVADEAMRHAISKLAHLHFAATAQSRRRLIRMGEDRAFVFKTGSPAVDALRGVVLADDAPELIVMQHPIGAASKQEYRWMDATLKATKKYERMVMAPNHDPGREGILAAIADHSVTPIDHLPRLRFLSLLAGAKALIGNSSAGLIEAAALRTPAVNIGPRQGGRERPATVIDCDARVKTIRQSVKIALDLDTRQLRHPYGDGRAGQRIADHLASIDLRSVNPRKRNTY